MVYHADIGRLVPHRLVAAGDVDDGEAAEAEVECVRGFDMEAGIVRAAVGDGVRHRGEVVARAGADESREAAHAR